MTPRYARPDEVSGPPGGAMDPSNEAEQAAYDGAAPPQYPVGDPSGYASAEPGDGDPYAQPEASADPQDPGYVIGDVDDAEIDATLEGYGSWDDVDGYGQVWRPDAAVVGSDFTPYETGGTWVDTDYGWSFGSDSSWGWLPYHYGRWNWFNDHWGWVPGHKWGPAWVEWRHGGGYVGWRPLQPEGNNHHAHDANWRFTAVSDFGKRNVHAHLFQNPAEGLRVTSPVSRPPVRGTLVSAASVMRSRLGVRSRLDDPSRSSRPVRPAARTDRPTWQNHRAYQPTRTYQPVRPDQGSRSYQSYQPPRTYQQPARYQQPTRYEQPTRTYQPPARTYQPPTRAYEPPARTYQPPTFSGGSRPSGGSVSSGGSSSGASSSSHATSSSGGGGGGGHHR